MTIRSPGPKTEQRGPFQTVEVPIFGLRDVIGGSVSVRAPPGVGTLVITVRLLNVTVNFNLNRIIDGRRSVLFIAIVCAQVRHAGCQSAAPQTCLPVLDIPLPSRHQHLFNLNQHYQQLQRQPSRRLAVVFVWVRTEASTIDWEAQGNACGNTNSTSSSRGITNSEHHALLFIPNTYAR